MATGTVSPVSATYADSSAHGVVIAGGYGVQITVKSGHLLIQDGLGRARRERRIPRMPRTVERLVILSSTGMITTEAIRWLNDAGIQWVHLAHDGRTIAISGPQTQDARLLRAQSRAHSDGDLAAVGQEITRYLLGVKLTGQAENLDKFLSGAGASIIRDYTEAHVIAEGKAAETYWHAWCGHVAVAWSPADLFKVPAHWSGFTQRPSLNGCQPVNADATDPVNAILNYLYRVAEIECVHACHAYGLHPALGISHTDKAGRDSMALDLLEAIRPLCERIALELLAPDGVIPYVNGKPAYFDRRWFHETSDGTIRLVAPLTHRLASHAAELAEAIQPHVYKVAQMLAHAANGIVSVKRPLKPAKPTGIHKGTNLARLRPGTTVAQIIPDAIWQELEPILPARPSQVRGRNTAKPARAIVASIVVRYMLRCGWSDVPITSKGLVNRWQDHWQESGAWVKAESILNESGHLAALLV